VPFADLFEAYGLAHESRPARGRGCWLVLPRGFVVRGEAEWCFFVFNSVACPVPCGYLGCVAALGRRWFSWDIVLWIWDL